MARIAIHGKNYYKYRRLPAKRLPFNNLADIKKAVSNPFKKRGATNPVNCEVFEAPAKTFRQQ